MKVTGHKRLLKKFFEKKERKIANISKTSP
jgi:hypothetical protein